MNGNQMLRVVAYISLAIGIGWLVPAAWGFIAFGVLVLFDTTVLNKTIFKSVVGDRSEFVVRTPVKRSSPVTTEAELTTPKAKA